MDSIHPYIIFLCQLRPPLDHPFKGDLAVGQRAKRLHRDHVRQAVLDHRLDIAVAVGQHGVGIQRILSLLVFLGGGPLRFRQQPHLYGRRRFPDQGGSQRHNPTGSTVQILFKTHSTAAAEVVGKNSLILREVIIGKEQPVRRVFRQKSPQLLFYAIHQRRIKAGICNQPGAVIGRFQVKEAVNVKPTAARSANNILQRVKYRVGRGAGGAVIDGPLVVAGPN